MAFIEAADVLISNDSGPDAYQYSRRWERRLWAFLDPVSPVWFPYDKPHEVLYAEVPCSHCGLEACPG